jgi:ribosome biogenesis GTPase
MAGRIAVENRDIWLAYTPLGEMWCEMRGRLRHDAVGREDLPAVGDWVVLRHREQDRATIEAILPRRSAFVRKQAGFKTAGQVLAANIDQVWIVTSLTRELAARRIERYLAIAWDSGAQPVIVLTKSDLGDADPDRVAEVEHVAVGAGVDMRVEIVTTSAITGDGIEQLQMLLDGHRTAALIGSSGVGKSTLANRLLGEQHFETQPTRADHVGRHTTTHRELIRLPSGGLLVDTPGLREILAWDADGSDSVFADIEALMQSCRFNDCGHRSEPGCAVRAAIADGSIDPARVAQYDKMQRELVRLERRKDGLETRNAKRRHKEISKYARELKKLRG